jgi:hypothetical protein
LHSSIVCQFGIGGEGRGCSGFRESNRLH